MTVTHDFSSPRNLFEKLIREGERMSIEVSGDNIFNFVSTAFHLQHWIKHSPLISSEVMKRLLRQISANKDIKHCQAIARAKEHFKTEISENSAKLLVGNDKIDLEEFKTNILNLYSNYFTVKGR